MKDTKGREWHFRFTARTVRELAAETRLDTKSLTGDDSLLQQVGKDESMLYTVLWVTVRPQAIAAGVSEDEWFESLDNDGLQDAAREWVEAYINFSQPARKKVLMKTLQATQKKFEKSEAAVEQAIASGEIDRVIAQAMSEPSPSPILPSSTTIAAK